MPRLAALTANPRNPCRAWGDTPGDRHSAAGELIARAPVQPPLKQAIPLILTPQPAQSRTSTCAPNPLVLRRQRQQNLDNRIPAPLEDRLRLSALHTAYFDAPELCPPDQLNAYGKIA